MNRCIRNILERRERAMTDFRITDCGSVCQVEALSPAARDFAKENFAVEGWQGLPHVFMTDWRCARDLAEQLLGENWKIDWRV
jgi:hypothetical protein